MPPDFLISIAVGASIPLLVTHVTVWAALLLPAYLLFAARKPLAQYLRLAWVLHKTHLRCPACQQLLTPLQIDDALTCGTITTYPHKQCQRHSTMLELRRLSYHKDAQAFAAVLQDLTNKTGKAPLGFRVVP